MAGISSILIATDFSEPSRAAFEAGLRLAIDLKATVLLVHALDPAMPVDPLLSGRRFGGKTVTTGRSATGESAEATRWADEARRTGLQVQTVVRAGRSAEIILEEARKANAALIVLGTHGRSGWRKVLLGSVASAVVQGADRPLLVVPKTRDGR